MKYFKVGGDVLGYEFTGEKFTCSVNNLTGSRKIELAPWSFSGGYIVKILKTKLVTQKNVCEVKTDFEKFLDSVAVGGSACDYIVRAQFKKIIGMEE